MCGFDKHLLAARLVPLPRHGNFTKKITYTSDFFIIIRYLLSTQSMISRLYHGKYKAKANVLLRRWMIQGNREHSQSGTVTVEKQQHKAKAKAKEIGLLRKGKF